MRFLVVAALFSRLFGFVWLFGWISACLGMKLGFNLLGVLVIVVFVWVGFTWFGLLPSLLFVGFAVTIDWFSRLVLFV